jgi:hypothetical protein
MEENKPVTFHVQGDKEYIYYIPHKDADIAMCQIFTLFDSLSKEYNPVVEFFDDSFGHDFGIHNAYHFELGAQNTQKVFIDISRADCDFDEFMNVLAFEYKRYRTFTDKENRVPPFIVVLKVKCKKFEVLTDPNIKCIEAHLEWEEYNALR